MTTRRFVTGALLRRPAETVATAVSLGVLIAFAAALGSFVGQTGSRLTRTAAARVPVDWQVQLDAGADVHAVTAALAAVPGFRGAAEVDYARVPGLQAATAAGVQTTGAAYVVSVPIGYAAFAPSELRPLLGATEGAALQQQTAANLSSTVGSGVTVLGTGHPVVIAGVVDLPNAGTFFQTVGSAAGAAAAAPPDNVLLVPRGSFSSIVGSAPVVRQLHVRLDHAGLPSDPATAADVVAQRAGHLATLLSGQVLVGDNLKATLSAAREDAIFARLLVLLLAVPGLILAAVVAGLVMSTGNVRRLDDLRLLVLRGATPTRCAVVMGSIGLAEGALGVALGGVGALLSARAALGASASVDSVWLATAGALGLGLSIAVHVAPVGSLRRRPVPRVAREVARGRLPLPLRLGADVILLGASAVVFWLTARSGYHVLVVPEGVPVASVNYAALLAPALAWPGAALLLWRLTALSLLRSRPTPQEDPRGAMRDLRQHAVRQRRNLVARGAVGLAVGLAVTLSTAVFTATYDRQARVDTALTVGSDVAVTLPPDSTAGLDPAIARVSGVAAVEQVSHRLAYVGPDLQDLYGVDAATIGRAAPLQDAFTPGSSVSAVLARLGRTPDGVLLSQETLHDYQLAIGDLVRLRLRDLSGAYATVPFHVVGVVTEFATAPRDSFLIANRAYVARTTGRPQVQTLLVRTHHPASVAAAVHAPSAALVNDISAPRVAVPSASGLAAGSLRGLARLTLAFGVLLSAASTALVLGAGAVSRRRSLVTLGLMGATFRQRAGFVWTEAGWILVSGTLGGLAVGALIAFELVKILTGIFDPPPERLALPGVFLGVTLAGGVVTAALATVAITRHVGRVDPSRLRDL